MAPECCKLLSLPKVIITYGLPGENQRSVQTLHLLIMLACLSCLCVCLYACTGDLSDHRSLSSLRTHCGYQNSWCSRCHKGHSTGCHLCVSPETLPCISRWHCSTQQCKCRLSSCCCFLNCLGNKDEKSVYRLGIDILDIPDSRVQSWIWKQWMWSAEFPLILRSTADWRQSPSVQYLILSLPGSL